MNPKKRGEGQTRLTIFFPPLITSLILGFSMSALTSLMVSRSKATRSASSRACSKQRLPYHSHVSLELPLKHLEEVVSMEIDRDHEGPETLYSEVPEGLRHAQV